MPQAGKYAENGNVKADELPTIGTETLFIGPEPSCRLFARNKFYNYTVSLELNKLYNFAL